MLVVRVKRLRYDDPAEELCVFEDVNHTNKKSKRGGRAALVSQMSSLQTADPQSQPQPSVESRHGSKLVLRRVSTIDNHGITRQSTALDSATASVLRQSGDDPSAAGGSVKRSKVIVAQGGSRSLLIPGQESCILVDMMQIANQQELLEKQFREQQQQKPESASKSKILSPPTRALARALPIALKNGDFNEISAALLQGADVNHRLADSQGGLTALMVAAMRGNLRMVRRLLNDQADVLLRNTQGVLAFDLVKQSTLNSADCNEIRSLLQTAMVKAHREYVHKIQRDQQQQQQDPDSSSTNGNEFVFDIYCVQDEAMDVVDASEELLPTTTTTSSDGKMSSSMVHIDGLRIMEDGQVELMEYDSDWSDLADDEEPDSNDERFIGNDYPDEDDDENGAGLFADADEEQGGQSQQRRGRGEEDDSDYDLDQEEEEDRYRLQNARLERQLQSQVPMFDRVRGSSVSRVLRPHTIGGVAGGDDAGTLRTSAALRKLWGEGQGSEDDEAAAMGDNDGADMEDMDDSVPMRERIQQMRMRTGMDFASDVREFRDNGLAKYGVDLSDDETDARMLMDDVDGVRALDRSTVAYDSDLDQSD